MTRRCRACGEVSSVDYRCEHCGADLVEQTPDRDHDRDRNRELRADGGTDTDTAAYLNKEVELRIRGKRVHVQALVSILSTASVQLRTAGLEPAAALAYAVAEDAISLDEATNNLASMFATRGDGWRTDDPTDALDVDLVSIATDGGRDQGDTEYFVVDEDRSTVVAGPFQSKEGAAEDARDRGPQHIVATETILEMIELTSSTTLRWETGDDLLTDGGQDVEQVASYSDLAASPDLGGRDVDVVAELLLEHGHKSDWLIAWVAKWILDEKGLDPVDRTHQIVHGRIERETEKAYCVAVGREEVWLPKSQLTVFERADDADIRVPQRGLGEFAHEGGEQA